MEVITAEKIVEDMWQAYADAQCGWQDSTSYHGHTMCDKSGMLAAGAVLSSYLMEGVPDGIKHPDIPAHYESNDERRP